MANDGTLKFDTRIDSSGFQEGISSISNMAKKGMQATGDILKGSIAAITGLGAAAVKVGTDFEGAMSTVEAISGVSGKELEALTEKAKEMGATTKFSATESANAFEYMAMAGWKTESMLSGIEGIMNLAAASGEDLAATSDIVTDALTAFGMAASDSTHFADVLAQASSNANTNVAMLGESFKYVAPVAGTLGYSAEDTAVALGLMANAGIKGSQAGTSLRTALTNMVSPTKDMVGVMNQFGIEIEKADGSMKPFGQLMEELRKKFRITTEEERKQNYVMAEQRLVSEGLGDRLAGLSEEQKRLELAYYEGIPAVEAMSEAMLKAEAKDRLGIKLTKERTLTEEEYYQLAASIGKDALDGLTEAKQAEAASTLFGKEAMSGMLNIINASEEDYRKLTDAIYSCDGAAAKMAETMSNNLQGQITILKSGLEGLGISLYETMQAPCMEIVKEAQRMVQELQEAFNDGGLDSLVTTFGSVLSRIVERVAGAAPDLIDAAAGLVGSFCDSLKSSPTIGDAAAGLITSLVTGLFSCAGDIWTTAIVLAGKMADGLAAGAPQMAQAAARCAADIVECLIDWAPDFIDAGKRMIQGIIQGIGEEFPSLGAFLSGLFEGFSSTLEPILSGIVQVTEGIFSVLGSADPAAMESLGKAIGTIAAAMVTMHGAKAAAGNVKSVVSMVNGFSGSVKTALEVVPKLAEGFQLLSGGAGTFSEVLALEFPKLAGMISNVGSMFSTVKTVIASIGTTVTGVAAVIGGAILAVTNFFDMLQNGFSWVKEALMALGVAITAVGAVILGAPAAVAAAVAGIVAAVATLVVLIKDNWTQIADFFIGIGEAIGNFFQSVPGTVKNLINQVVVFFSELPNQIAYWMGYLTGIILKWGIDFAGWVTTEIPKIIQNIVTFFSQLPGKIWTWLVDVVNKARQWGANLLSTASSAAQNAVNKVVEWFSQLPGKVWTWLVNTVAKVTQFAADLKTKAAAAAQGFVTSLVDGVKGLPDKFKEIGANIVTGIWNGISSGWDWLVNKVKGLAESLYEGAKDALGIESPSKVFAREVGQWIPPGIGSGIEKAMPALQRELDEEMNALANRMQEAVAIETGGITVRTRANAEHNASTEYPKGGGDTYVDQHIEQENNYHVPVVSPAEASKAQREAARNLLGGVK